MLRKRAIRLNEKRAIKLKEKELSNSIKKRAAESSVCPLFVYYQLSKIFTLFHREQIELTIQI